MKILIPLASLMLLTILTSCGKEEPSAKGSPEYLSEIEDWHNKRISNLKKEESWLNLVGLYWLKEGKNTFGSAKDNDIVFPEGSAQDYMGSFIKTDSIITIKVNEGIDIRTGESKVEEMQLEHDLTGNPTRLTYETLRFYVIRRNNLYGIRLRDTEAKLYKEFSGIERYPVNIDWRKEATYTPYDPPKKITIPTYHGTVEEEISPGQLTFMHNGAKFTMDAIDSGNRLFLLFADETSGEETYGGGRYIYTDKADSNGIVIIDFNKAYNPPCVFTKYATCPLPPKNNYLALKITAGEKVYGKH